MQFSRAATLWATVLTLSGIFSAIPLVLADDERTTAKDVYESQPDMFQEKLKAFVLSAEAHFTSVSLGELQALPELIQVEGGDWNYKSMYLVVLTTDGIVFAHGEDPSKNFTSVINDVDDNGEEVVKEIIAVAGGEEGGFVEYTWDDPSTDEDVNPRTCYAILTAHPQYPREFVIVGGYHHNVVSTDEEPESPEVSAMDVRDRETLKAFVKSAKAHAESLTESIRINEFRGSQWRFESVYIFILNDEGVIRWHGANADLVGQDLSGLEDAVTGSLFTLEIIEAATSGGGYVEYHFDDPSVEGDEDHTSPKVTYAETFTSPLPNLFPDQNLIIASGFYARHQVALDFAHFANGGGITSDIVVVNVGSSAVRPNIYFYDNQGHLIDPDSVVGVMEQGLEVTSYGALTLQEEIPSLGEVTISTHGRGELATGSVKVVSDGSNSPIGGVLRFDLAGVGVAGVGASQPVQDAIFPARRADDGINTGVALRNLSESDLALTCHLMKDGQELDDKTVNLPANGQDAKFIDQIFSGSDTSDFTGSVRCSVSSGAQKFTAVALELDATNGIFTTLPVVPVSR